MLSGPAQRHVWARPRSVWRHGSADVAARRRYRAADSLRADARCARSGRRQREEERQRQLRGTGSLVSGAGIPTVYLSGDNSLDRTCRSRRGHDGGAHRRGCALCRCRPGAAKERGRPRTSPATRRDAAAVIGVAAGHPAHYDRWATSARVLTRSSRRSTKPAWHTCCRWRSRGMDHPGGG